MKHDNIKTLGGSFEGLSIPKQTSEENRLGQLVMGEDYALKFRGQSGLVSVASTLDIHFIFDAFTFRSIASGNVRPTRDSLAASGTGYEEQHFFRSNDFFHVNDGIQKFLMPGDGVYRIIARGSGDDICLRAEVTVELALGKNDVISILCGNRSADGLYGGHGATFVESAALGLIAVAGGAGGGRRPGHGTGNVGVGNARINLENPGDGSGGISVRAYQQGWGSGTSIGGAGYIGDARWPTSNIPPGGFKGVLGKSYLNGAEPGYGSPIEYGGTIVAGAFGGGGGASFAPQWRGFGGGGGYTGGDATNGVTFPSTRAGSGGTSFAIRGDGVTHRSARLESSTDGGTCHIQFIRPLI